MAENKNAKKAAAAAAAAPAEETTSTPSQQARTEKKKSRWTPATCLKAAKRFETREEWQHNAPSSYKAAVAKGWDHDCCKHMRPGVAVKAKSASKAKAKVAKATPTKTARRTTKTA